MTAAYEWLAAASAWWWPRFADHLWQTTLFALVVLAALLVLRRGTARWRHTLCLLASAKFIVPVALLVILAQQTGIESLFRVGRPSAENARLLSGFSEPMATLASTYEVTVVATQATGRQQIFLGLTAVWFAGTTSLLLLWAIRRRRFARSLRLSPPVQRGREWNALKRAQESLHLKRNVGLVISPLKIEPGVWRVWRPVIVLPESMATFLDDSELEAIMLHEIIHVQRRDNLVGQLQLALCALLWFHPLIWVISRRLFNEREQACDERVMEVCGAPEAYASSILKVVRFCFGWRVAGVIGAASGTNLRRRIENIMSTGNTKRSAGGAARLLAAALVGLGLLISVAAGVYHHPLAVSAAAREPVVRAVNSGDPLTVAPEVFADKKVRKAKPSPPPPPPVESATTVAPADAPHPPQPAQPAEPAQPAQAPAPPEQEDPDKADKDKPSKDKSKKIKKGELIEAPLPAYPDEVKKQKIEGIVSVVITIGNEGNVIFAKAKSGPEELYGVSEAAALKARFKPTILDGNSVKVSGVMTYNFALDKE